MNHPGETEARNDCVGEGQRQFDGQNHQSARTGAVEHGSWGIYGTGSHYQVMTGEDMED
jgi:hypothetical protein